MPMPSALASLGSLMDTSFPSFLITPSSGWYRPKSTLISVDLPAPFSPSKAWISPLRSCKVMLSLATMPGNLLVMLSISMAYWFSKKHTSQLVIRCSGVWASPCLCESSTPNGAGIIFLTRAPASVGETGALVKSPERKANLPPGEIMVYLMLPRSFTVTADTAGIAVVSLDTVTTPLNMSATSLL